MGPSPRTVRVLAGSITCLALLAAGQVDAGAARPERRDLDQRSTTTPTATLPSGNLIQNPGAEAATDGSLPSWETTPGFVAELYGSDFRPPIEVSQRIGGGASLFAGGSEADVSSGSQVVDVSAGASQIDAGTVIARLSAYLGGIDAENDYAEVVATFLPAVGEQPLGQAARLGPVTAADRGFVTDLRPRSTERTIPVGTRRIQVTIISTRFEGIYTDGYADNLSLTLTDRPVPPVPPVTTKVPDVKVKGRRVKGRISAAAPCKAGRTVVVKKGKKTLGTARSQKSGSFSIKTKKHKKGKLTVTIRKRTVGSTICSQVTKKVPGRH